MIILFVFQSVNPLLEAVKSNYQKIYTWLLHDEDLINIQNMDDHECFKWSIVRYLNPEIHHPAKISKDDKAVKIWYTHKIEKIIPSALVFLAKKTKKTIQSMYLKMLWRKTCWFGINSRRRKEALSYY